MSERLLLQGIEVRPKIMIATRLIPEAGETLCNQPLEKIHGTQNAWIVRVPFRKPNGELSIGYRALRYGRTWRTSPMMWKGRPCAVERTSRSCNR